jgi:hypothetical protein
MCIISQYLKNILKIFLFAHKELVLIGLALLPSIIGKVDKIYETNIFRHCAI